MSHFLRSVVAWAEEKHDIEAILLVGSHASGKARPDSDIDLIVLTSQRAAWLADQSWVSTFGIPAKIQRETWGAVTSLRVQYEHGPEVEFGMAEPSWACADPIDAGTQRVILDGVQTLWDPKGIIGDLLGRIAASDRARD